MIKFCRHKNQHTPYKPYPTQHKHNKRPISKKEVLKGLRFHGWNIVKHVFTKEHAIHLKHKAHTESSQWRHNGRDGVSNHQPRDCLLNLLYRHGSKNTLKLRVTGLCAGNLPVTGEFPAWKANNAENVSIWWRHHGSDLSSMNHIAWKFQ